MRAFHTNWTAPFFARNPHANYEVEPFELLTTALSALFWERCGGTISMLCDSRAAGYYCNYGLDGLWDGGIQTVLDEIPREIDPNIFWAAGKLFALRAHGAPCIMLDTDFIVWKPIEHLLDGVSLAAIHREDIMPDVYPNADALSAAKGFDFSKLDWSVNPANTALSYFGNQEFLTYYTDCAISFMRTCVSADNPLTYMVFAEQRLLAMLAKAQNILLCALSDLPALLLPASNISPTFGGLSNKCAPILHYTSNFAAGVQGVCRQSFRNGAKLYRVSLCLHITFHHNFCGGNMPPFF